MASPVSAVRPVVAEPAPAPAQKHVLLFMHDFSRTGVVLNAVRLANALVGRGHQVRFLVCNATGRADHPIDPEVVVEIAGEPAPRWLPRGLRLLAAIPTIRKAVRSARPDIFVSLGNHGHLPAMIALIRLAGMRKLLRMSNDADRIGDSALIRGVRNILLRWTIAAADQLMLVSPHLAQHPAIRRAEGQGKVVIVPNGIEIEEVRRRVRGARVYDLRPGRAVSVLAIGRLVPHKNFETLIRAIAVADRERSLHLTIIGGGSPAYRDKLEALAQSLGIEDRVKLLGEVDDPLPRLAAADVFVLPSLREGSSNVRFPVV